MTIGSATSSHPISYTPSPPTSQTASVESNPSERENDGDRDDADAKVQNTSAKSPPAAVGKGLGQLVDISL
ncbi:hypothetical protein [Pleomorphomonas sp. PLEO]|uniref:hypothetical protein n=1 Tax=Pleomorphomonas sp. PLEO TaxID=3239306 RepID=UPI00351EA43A